MDPGKITTDLPVHPQVQSQASSEPSSPFPKAIPAPYSGDQISPGLTTSSNRCPSLVYNIESPTHSDHSPESRSPSTGNPSPGPAIASSPHSNHISPSWQHLNIHASRWLRDRTKMNTNQGVAIQDHRGQVPGVAPYNPRSIESLPWRPSVTAAPERGHSSIPVASSGSIATMSYPPAFQHTTPPTISPYADHFGWPCSQPSFPQGGTGSTGSRASIRRMDTGQIFNQEFFAYGYDRGGGKITLLVPVDRLPPIVGVPQTVTDSSGILILPPPPGCGPSGLSSNPSSLTLRHTPNNQSSDGNVQSQIDSIVASSSTADPPPIKKKVYCTKWVHEGICAFVHGPTGCKYKHEMPTDSATLHDLGLLGLPAWWKRQQAQLQRQCRQYEASDAPICLDRSRETSPRSHGSRWERREITGSFTPPRSAVSDSSSNSPSPVPAADNSSNRLVHQTRPRRLDTVQGLGASGHNETATRQPWSRQPEFASNRPSQYGPIGPPSKTERDADRQQV